LSNDNILRANAVSREEKTLVLDSGTPCLHSNDIFRGKFSTPLKQYSLSGTSSNILRANAVSREEKTLVLDLLCSLERYWAFLELVRDDV